MSQPKTDSIVPAELAKLGEQSAAAILALYEQDPETAALLEEDMTPVEYFGRLLRSDQAQAALGFLAYGLPRRDALAWCLRCVRETSPAEPTGLAAAAIDAAAVWIEEPTEERRYSAMVAAEEVGFDTPQGCLALAVFFSGGSMAPADCPNVPIAESYCPRTVEVALQLCAIQEPERADEVARQLALLGAEAANTPAPWDA